MDAVRTREDGMYDAPKARLEEVVPYRDSILRGFAGGWGALLLGAAIAVGWTSCVPDLLRAAALPLWHVVKLAWILFFAPVFWLGVRQHLRGRHRAAFGVVLALVSLVVLIVLLLAYGSATL